MVPFHPFLLSICTHLVSEMLLFFFLWILHGDVSVLYPTPIRIYIGYVSDMGYGGDMMYPCNSGLSLSLALLLHYLVVFY
jgi:hypothetical protein